MKTKKLNKRCFSFSLMSKADNEDDFLNYVFFVKEDSVPMAVGRIIHEGVASDNFNELRKVQITCDNDKITSDKKVELNISTASNAILMSYLVRNNALLKSIVNGAVYEQQMVVIFKFDGVSVLFKGIFDLIHFDKGEALEIKTTFANRFTIHKKIDQYHYDMQVYCLRLVASHVLSVLNIRFLFIRKIFPFDIIDFNVNNAILSAGRKKFVSYFRRSVDIIKRNNLGGLFFL